MQRISSGPVMVRECTRSSVFSRNVSVSPTSFLCSSQSSSNGSLGSGLDCNLVVVDMTTASSEVQEDNQFESCSLHTPMEQSDDAGASDTLVRLNPYFYLMLIMLITAAFV